ncbi:MAG: polymer-forming cytoskeletal protein [Microscillaceae bacterium]|nr:polymer-forming cytoskeletal protein [Microscillaceae bacterium]MDW8461136.1 polymer-forming cytoskeletal protein [Cytophagales bacterium]
MGMFGTQKDNHKELVELSNSSTIIGKGTTLDGNIETYGNIRVEGKVIGNIKSKAKVVLGDTAVVQGSLIAQNAELAGEIKGTVEVIELLVLKGTALVQGDIVCNKLVVESGAVFNGGCKMGNVSKEIKIEGAVNANKKTQLNNTNA